jgi:hypothetical protein
MVRFDCRNIEGTVKGRACEPKNCGGDVLQAESSRGEASHEARRNARFSTVLTSRFYPTQILSSEEGR